MNENFCTLGEIIDEFSLKPVYLPEDGRNIKITCNEVNRPGLQLTGYFEFFENARIQIVGRVERTYLESLDLTMFKTDKVTDMAGLFANCRNLKDGMPWSLTI